MRISETARFTGGGVGRPLAYYPYNEIYYKKLQDKIRQDSHSIRLNHHLKRVSFFNKLANKIANVLYNNIDDNGYAAGGGLGVIFNDISTGY